MEERLNPKNKMPITTRPVSRRKNSIIIECEQADYEINMDRIPDPDALLQWTFHLSNKTWVTRRILNDFIWTVCLEKGWNVYRQQL